MRKLLLSIILSITVALPILAAGTFTVTTTNDNGAGSLRVAMLNAIVSGSGIVSIQTSGTITLASALPVITAPITIACTNTSGITVSGNNAYRVFEVQLATGIVTFKNLNIINGVGAGGGGILAITSNNGKVALENCTISGCNATGSQAYGGAICSSADVDLLNCTLAGNSAADGGGAIEMIDGTGVSTLTINHSTITQNATVASSIAGGVDVYLNKIIISNSIVGNNTNGNASSSRDISLDASNINTQISSYNLYTTAPFMASGTGDLVNKSVAELGLSALANNGGGVKTQALTPVSLARNSATGVLATDARGITRDTKPDRGAYEAQAAFDIALSASVINENVAANSVVGTLSSMDNDAGDTFTYSLVSGTGDTDNAYFNISGSSLRITNSPDFEAKNSYTVRVRTTDQDGFTYEKAFTIAINNLNEAPADIALSASAINENVAVNSIVGALSTIDPDAGNTFTYTLVAGTGDGDNASFNISGSSLRITNSPDFEAKNSYTVRVRTTDQVGFTYEKAFTIAINNLNEAPINIALSATAINENVAANSPIGTISSTDPDAGNTFTYTLVAGTGDGDNASFNISGSSLRITNSPDFEAKNSYTVRVRTTDQDGFTYEKPFTITINNLNEAPADIALSVSAINENMAANSIVGALSTTDPDAGDTFTYSLVAGTGSIDNASFNISGGNLRITDSPDFETKSSYLVRVRTTDQGGLYFEKAVTITVNDLNETSSIITQAVSNIATTTAIGGGNITDLGISNPAAYGVCWNTTGMPTISDSKVDNGAVSVTGVFTAAMAGLTANTTYYVRAFATNSAGTSYGTEVSFTTNYASQAITFNSLPTKTYGDVAYSLGATSTSELAVSYASDNTAVATVSGNIITIVGAGTANIIASQAGDATYAAAPSVTQRLTVNKKVLTITDSKVITSKIVDGNNTAVVSFSGNLQGLLTNDLNNVSVIATANYDNATVGINKTITVVYALGGSAAGNYIAPVDFLVTGAKITDITSGINEPKASDSEGITAYPSQVVVGQACTVKVTGIADNDLQGAALCVYTMQGVRVYHSTKVELSNSIYLPSIEGIYLGRVTTTKGKEFQFKVIVTK